ncbi:NAD(P)/FAD-dependent oxidoreductase [Paeniglutamicibacter sulfureus]|uniref:NADPH-dependent 2,4-dienoyl-CoA reductase/sulfur reductase-like enzyme n=1 Tax=Paeniglutamicibacter sulfureus TaxID=43666 RepID=A0ABU2BLV3_9MICC|nr:FAD-dependent oxidoreductase [Paeniglutamicibacter sulfureus]MDR7359271.1 NADPH-dependent 2,4-dienoyl-CoA reductase/sulfur reductase-like enzyme [Paeniglutamicibacter sulfureus]
MSVESVVIIGGGLSGFTAAKELRGRGFAGTLSIIDPEGLPYDRPPLSKDYLAGSKDAAGIALAPATWYVENNVTVITGTATALDPDAGTATLADGRVLVADRFVLATGGRARRLSIPGGDLPGVLELRTKNDADTLRGLLAPGVRLAIVGAGLIGAETASSARAFGAEVTLVDPVEIPLVPAIGEVLASRLHAMHSEHQVRTVTGIPEEITQDAEGYGILLSTGETIAADVVLVGIGIIAATELAEAAGLDTDNGVLVDERGATSHPRVFAVGDSARTRLADGTLLRRAEHWEHAMNAGATAAAAILNQEPPVHGASWFWSDRHGVHVEGVGSMHGDGEHVVRMLDGVPIAAFRLDAEGLMLGAAAIDGGLTVRAARRIIDRSIKVDPLALADPATELKKLAR